METLPAKLDFDDVARLVLEQLPKDRREAIEAKARDRTIPPVDSRARRYAINLWRGLCPSAAAKEAGLSLRGDWHIITMARFDPVYNAIYTAADSQARQRIAAKAVSVVEQAMDGEQITKEAARLAPWVLGGSLDHGGGGGGGGKSGTPSVVINLSTLPNSALQSVATGDGKTITAQIIED